MKKLVSGNKELDFFSTNESSSIDFYSDNDLITALEKVITLTLLRHLSIAKKAKPKKAAIEVKMDSHTQRSKSVSKMRLTKLIINVKLIATIQRSEGETLL